MKKVAIVGGGVTGAVAASQLARLLGPLCRVTLFDQGRGLGGRCSHRRVSAVDGARLDAEESGGVAAFAFDHGCQFFRADTAEFREVVLEQWLREGCCEEWKGRFGSIGEEARDFFGVGPAAAAQRVFCGVGGMHAIVCGAVRNAVGVAENVGGTLEVKAGVRVGGLERLELGGRSRWQLLGVEGDLAYHDTKRNDKAVEQRASNALGTFDYVLVTDASAAMAGWHRASAGLPRSFVDSAAKRVRDRVRVALFTAMVAFEEAVPTDLDAITFDNDTLWFAARTTSKPGFGEHGREICGDCWTLVCTPAYAAAEISRVPMQDPKTGAFRPQSPSSLEAPARALLAAFEDALGLADLPQVQYIAAQRWGSAMPAPTHLAGFDSNGQSATTKEIVGVLYDSSKHLPLAPQQEDQMKEAAAKVDDFVHDPDNGLYYAGDFCSPSPPGVESAALSGLHAAQSIALSISQ